MKAFYTDGIKRQLVNNFCAKSQFHFCIVIIWSKDNSNITYIHIMVPFHSLVTECMTDNLTYNLNHMIEVWK